MAEANKTIPQDCSDPNEIFSGYGGPCEPTCHNPEINTNGNCKAACICSGGYVRDEFTGKCIKLEHCCPNQYEVYDECGSACPLTCESPYSTPCIEICNPGCFCSYGTIRDTASGKCVNISDCTCKSKDEEFKECGTSCPPTCGKTDLMCIMMCRAGCFCKEGLIRDDSTGKCVNVNDCTCPTKDEVFSQCGAYCARTCRNPNPKICPAICVGGCLCKDKNKVRDENTGKCVNIEECTCKDENAEFNPCGSACQPNCTHPEFPIACTKQCVPGCYCKKGTIKDTETDRCVPPSDCFCNLQERCGKNEVFHYGPACESSCLNPNTKNKVEHSNNCYCKKGYFRNEKTGRCVRLKNCCNSKDNEVYNLCVSVGRVCENTCSSPNKEQICKAPCAPGCKCKQGFLLDDTRPYPDNTQKCIPKELCYMKGI